MISILFKGFLDINKIVKIYFFKIAFIILHSFFRIINKTSSKRKKNEKCIYAPFLMIIMIFLDLCHVFVDAKVLIDSMNRNR